MERGLRLKQLREKKNLSQTEAARFIGVSKQSLFKYENDIITNIPSDIIERIAKLYDTTPQYIMGWMDENGEPTLLGRLGEATINNMEKKQEMANDLYDRFENASPEIQQAISALLGFPQPDAGLPRSPEDNA